MTGQTHIFAAKLALLADLQASPDLAGAGVRVTYGGPTEAGDYAREHVHLGARDAAGVEAHTQDWHAIGQRSRSERFELPVTVIVRKLGDHEQTVETRAWQLLQAIERAVIADITLAGTVNWAAVIRAPQRNQPTTEPGWVTTIEPRVGCFVNRI